jgi:hypothetical protein
MWANESHFTLPGRAEEPNNGWQPFGLPALQWFPAHAG